MLLFKNTMTISSPIYEDSLQIRRIVFIEEQNVSPDIEIDDKEERCIHVVGYKKEKAVVTARLLPLETNQYKVQRVAVLKKERGKHYGKYLMLELERIAREKDAASIVLGAQNHALPFYDRLGYTINSEEYSEAGILHHDMIKILD
ncbi:MAG TPA: GNAT family N-acetyltransferase [Candidatus Jeotgalibaca pullicola]|nr:GNAT family N-acetyltransferase [Candidatus Jeotgalibaca pullicola]